MASEDDKEEPICRPVPSTAGFDANDASRVRCEAEIAQAQRRCGTEAAMAGAAAGAACGGVTAALTKNAEITMMAALGCGYSAADATRNWCEGRVEKRVRKESDSCNLTDAFEGYEYDRAREFVENPSCSEPQDAQLLEEIKKRGSRRRDRDKKEDKKGVSTSSAGEPSERYAAADVTDIGAPSGARGASSAQLSVA